jgi:hypothetical protein
MPPIFYYNRYGVVSHLEEMIQCIAVLLTIFFSHWQILDPLLGWDLRTRNS